ncbi:molybdopterin-dependent oxidoreductase [uncultured Friedmanniella sp.]|uniref:molybdopterin-dependent oxidoreductase n=1 Tax=uncultured Friedmanniella sp. TaxID=335381 RepID=UPI0035CBF238
MSLLGTLLRLRGPRPDDFGSPVHDTAVVARIGRWLGIAIAICFVTGLISHNAQSATGIGLVPWPSWGYRLTQGLHVASGIAAIPLLLGKVFAAYPRLFVRPVLPRPSLDGLPVMLERASIGVLVGAAFFELSTGLLNINQWYVFGFLFVPVHYALAWVMAGALLVHVAVKLPIIRRHLTRAGQAEASLLPEPVSPIPEPVDGPVFTLRRARGAEVERRTFVRGVLTVSGVLGLLTVGQSFTPLSRLALLAPRQPGQANRQGVPINKTAAMAKVTSLVADADTTWTLTLTGPTGAVRTLTLADLLALPATTVRLPIACVEGWSVMASWTGVRVRDLLALVGGAGGWAARVTSLEQGSSYSVSTLPPAFADHEDTLLATRLNGEVLEVDHGYPARIIAPNRPGVLQTKWVQRIDGLLP